LGYAAFVIKNEKKSFLSNPQILELPLFTLKVPKWWTLEMTTDNQIQFKRTDTSYDWKAYFTWSDLTEKLTAVELLVQHIHKQKIMLDPEESIKAPAQKIYNHLAKFAEFSDLAHVENTGTKDESERIYFDAYLVTLKSGKYFYCYSESSVLNGCVEGPFFEEAMLQLNLN